MTADEAYRWLIGTSEGSAGDEFDIHVVASILALAIAEAQGGERSVCDGVGLEEASLRELFAEFFPGAAGAVESFARNDAPAVDDEEQSLRDILRMYSSGTSRLARHLGPMIARRCGCPHHLWQDLGLRERSELSRLMKRHFDRLAERNRNDMKWKKFLYRMVCRSEGFSLCSAPVCSDCDDFANCFGAEDGESRLARVRNGLEIAV
jgi:nitrogen fixation protein NifQ